jgi:cob(I)alamin adenosyltransferase
MTIYTKKGDKGTTSLLGGARVSKSIVRLEVLGCLDEANSTIGLLRSKLNSIGKKTKHDESFSLLNIELKEIQKSLLSIGADIATPYSASSTFQKRIDRIGAEFAKEIEEKIDLMEKTLPSLKYFILPGGSELASIAQIARSVIRRAERNTVRLNKGAKVNPNILMYLNRLSDYFFVLSRYLNRLTKIEEEVWN